MRALNLDVQLTRSVCTPGNQLNKLLCFVSTIVLSTTPIVRPIAPARQHIHSTCTVGKASIVSSPPADTTVSVPLLVCYVPVGKRLSVVLSWGGLLSFCPLGGVLVGAGWLGYFMAFGVLKGHQRFC